MSDTGFGPERKLSPEQEKALVERYLIVKSAHKISIEFGVSTITVSRTLRRLHVTPERAGHWHGRSLTPSEMEVVSARYEAGDTTPDIAKDIGVSIDTIRNALKRSGITLRTRWHDHTAEDSEATRIAYRANPGKRIRGLLVSRRSSAKRKGLQFDAALMAIAKSPPSNCKCCGAAFDLSDTERAPSIDRQDNSSGYVVGNVAVVCRRCNRIKTDASIAELETIISYMKIDL